jgi:hypothetical protein
MHVMQQLQSVGAHHFAVHTYEAQQIRTTPYHYSVRGKVKFCSDAGVRVMQAEGWWHGPEYERDNSLYFSY